MRKTLAVLVAASALSCWSFAQTKNQEEKQESKAQQAQKADNDANNPKGNITIINGPNVSPQDTSATITWTTSGNAATIVKYGTNANDLSQKSAQAGGERNHSVTLSSLTPGTTYHYAIMTDDNTVRQRGEFKTTGTASASASTSGAAASNGSSVSITSGPTPSPSSNSATITWTTNKNAANEVRYGTDPNNLSQHWYEAGGSTQHTATLSNLQPGTTYYFAIKERNGGTRTTGQFQTTGTATAATAATTTAPATGAVQFTEQPKLKAVGDKAVTIVWTTNVPSSSIVKYGSQMGVLGNQGQGAWGTNHSVTIGNLTPNTQYFFRARSGQTAATTVNGPQEGFKTLPAGSQAKNNPACCTVFSQ